MHDNALPKRSLRWPACARRWAFVVLVAVGAVGCGPSDPLDPIREMQQVGDFAGSLEPLRKLIEDDYDDPELHYRYGRALAASGQGSLAEWALREAMKDPEWLVPAGQLLAHAALGSGNHALAVDAANHILEQHPDNVQALLLRASAHAHSRLDPAAALADAERVLVLDPENLEVHEPRILALLALERAEEAGEAIAELGRLIEQQAPEGDLPGWHCATAAIFADESKEEELARERWEKCLELYPGHTNVVTNAAKFYDARGEHDRSLDLLRAAHEADPGLRSFRTLLALRLRDAGENDEAETVLLEGTRLGSPAETSGALIDLAKHYQEVERYEEAARAVDRAVEIVREVADPPPSLLLEQADARLLAGELDGALAVAKRMSVRAHQTMIQARVAQERGEHAQALEYYDEAFRLWPDNPWARYQAAESAEALGDFDRALAEYRASLRISQSATDAGSRAARILLAEKRPREAMAMLQSQAASAPLDRQSGLVSIRIWGWARQMPMVRQSLALLSEKPEAQGPAVVAAAQGLREGAGAEAALSALKKWQADGLVDWTQPGQADVLRLIVDLASERPEQERAWAEGQVRDALRAHPTEAALHEVLGHALELGKAGEQEIRSAYERAVELDPGRVRALLALARSERSRNPQRASSLRTQAAEAAAGDGDLQVEVARELVVAGDSELAEPLLEAALAADPLQGAAALQLASIQLAGGSATDRTLALAQRAVRLGGGADARDLLERVRELRRAPGEATGPGEQAGL